MPLNLDHATRFIEKLRIRDRDNGLIVPFKLRPQQWDVIERSKEHLRRKRRLFIIFLKARRVGISQLSNALGICHMAAFPAALAGTVAQNREVAKNNFEQICNFGKDLTPVFGRGSITHTKSVLTVPHSTTDSTFTHYTAAVVHKARGLTFSSLHLTEAAFYPYEGVFTALMNTLSSDPNNMCLVETTANGMEGPGETYYEYWQAAEAGENEFLPIFLPWYEDPAYILDPALAKDAPRDEYERWLMNEVRDHRTGKKAKIDKSRIAWFRETLSTKCEGLLDSWKAEFPSCLVADTRVSTNEGIIPISEAGKAEYTETGEVQKWGPQPISPVYRMTTRRGRIIEGTFDHPVWVLPGEWKWLGKLESGDRIKLSAPIFSKDIFVQKWNPVPGIDASVTIDDKWALLLGYFMGDGCWYKGAMDICCDAKDQDVVAEVSRLCDEICGSHSLKQISKVQGRKGCTVVKTGGGGTGKMNPISILHAFRQMGLLKLSGRDSWVRKVHVPNCIWKSPKEKVALFLSSLFECDGSASAIVNFGTCHEEFARDVQLLLLGFGINSSIRSSIKKSGLGKQYIQYFVNLNLVESARFVKLIGFRGERKRSKSYEAPERNLSVYEESYCLQDEVKSVEYFREDVTFDFTIKKVHCFGANGILTHNTPEEAFVASGNPAFTTEEVNFAKNSIEKPLYVGRCVLSSDGRHGEFQADHEGPLALYELPISKHHYFAGVDTARGEEANVTPGDYASIVMWNAETGNMAARYLSKVSPEEVAEIAAALGWYFNGAMLNVELNGLGFVTMKELRDRLYYPSQYLWKGRDDKADQSKRGMALGFETSERYRRMMMGLFRTALHRREVVPKDKVFVNQMIAAKMEMNYRWNVRIGHDDVLMAGFLGWIAKEQYHPHVCKVRLARNIFLDKSEEDKAKEQEQKRSSLPSWTQDGLVTAFGGIMQNGNEHLRKIVAYEKKRNNPNRLLGV